MLNELQYSLDFTKKAAMPCITTEISTKKQVVAHSSSFCANSASCSAKAR